MLEAKLAGDDADMSVSDATYVTSESVRKEAAKVSVNVGRQVCVCVLCVCVCVRACVCVCACVYVCEVRVCV